MTSVDASSSIDDSSAERQKCCMTTAAKAPPGRSRRTARQHAFPDHRQLIKHWPASNNSVQISVIERQFDRASHRFVALLLDPETHAFP